MSIDRRIELLVLLVFVMIVAFIFMTADIVQTAHVNGRILELLSDASVYFEQYRDRYAFNDVLENWTEFLVNSPILLMILFHGNLLLVQFLNAFVMIICLGVSQRCFQKPATKLFYICACLIFPYFSFGFLGLNKEIYAICGAMLFATYLRAGSPLMLMLSIVLALMARYYMVAPLLMLALVFPHMRAPRYYLTGLALAIISLVGPFAKSFVPEYSYVDLTKESGQIAVVFSTIIDNFGYALVYPVKYVVLVLVRPFGFAFGYNGDAVGAVVSVFSVIAAAGAVYAFATTRQNQRLIGPFVLSGFLAPIPMMWSEIMHWRYYSFVYIFFLFAFCIHRDGIPLQTSQAASLDNGPVTNV